VALAQARRELAEAPELGRRLRGAAGEALAARRFPAGNLETLFFKTENRWGRDMR
jgi:hypothetical protein